MTNTDSVAMNLPGTSRNCTGVESEPAVIVDDHSQFDDGKGGTGTAAAVFKCGEERDCNINTEAAQKIPRSL